MCRNRVRIAIRIRWERGETRGVGQGGVASLGPPEADGMAPYRSLAIAVVIVAGVPTYRGGRV